MRRCGVLLLACCCATVVAVDPTRGGDPAGSTEAAKSTWAPDTRSPSNTPEVVQQSVKTPEKDEHGADRQLPGQAHRAPPPRTEAPTAVTEGAPVRVLHQQPTAEFLEDELDNQENIMTQLLGDYDKVKTISSGSDCMCQCTVRPIKRSDCDRLRTDDPAPHSYTVETVTKGTDCKRCVCLAPPSAVNPCEGEYRFKRLQEAGRDDIKLAAIMDLLEGSLYGLDLLKLHSVTTKLLTRVDNIEKAFSRNVTDRLKDKERMKDKVKDKEKGRRTQQRQEKKRLNDPGRAGQKQGAAANVSKQKNNEEHSMEGLRRSQLQDGLEPRQPIRNNTDHRQPIKDKSEPKKPIRDNNGVVVRGVAFYKAEGLSDFEEVEETGEEGGEYRTHASVDLLVSDQIPLPPPVQRQGPPITLDPKPATEKLKQAPSASAQTTAFQARATQTTSTTKAATTTVKQATKLTTTTPRTTVKPTTTKPTTTTTAAAAHTIRSTTNSPAHPTTLSGPYVAPPPDRRSLPDGSPIATKSRLSWTESPSERQTPTKRPGVCKDTVASVSEPVQQHLFGQSDGAWMRDARGHGNVIYLTNGHYGNSLLEFRDLDTFRLGQPSNSYQLPYSFTGTGHTVFGGAFFYNRAFSRDIVRYDLRRRHVVAWATLHDAILEEQVHRTLTEMEFAVDESGLWLLYPALDAEGFHQEVTLLVQLRPSDLAPLRSFRTGLRRGRYGDSFLVCGVLYALDGSDGARGNVTYAFDTHTLTHTVPSLALAGTSGRTAQLAYCPLDRKLYAWDAGRQLTYDVIFAY